MNNRNEVVQQVIKNEILHDKVCPYLGFQGDKEMRVEELIDWAKSYKCCDRCKRIAYVFNGANDIENYDLYFDYFNKHKVSVAVMQELFEKKQAKIAVVNNYFEIHCGEDTWRIPIKIKYGITELLHNNYTRRYGGKRIMDSNFHNQCFPKKTVVAALRFIINYDYNLFHNSY